MTTDTLDFPEIVDLPTAAAAPAPTANVPAVVTLREAALAKITKTEQDLRALATRYDKVAFDFTTPKGRKPTHFVGGPGVIDSHGKPVPPAPAVEVGVSSREIVCPYGAPGDKLWVREAWRAPLAYQLTPPRDVPLETPIAYQTDGAGTVVHLNVNKLRPPMFMPRWASRITLEITDVRVERLQDISEADAIAEGIERSGECNWRDYGDHPYNDFSSARRSYGSLWDQINGAGSWAANPFVWVLSVRRLDV